GGHLYADSTPVSKIFLTGRLQVIYWFGGWFGRRGKELNLLPLPCSDSALPMSYAPIGAGSTSRNRATSASVLRLFWQTYKCRVPIRPADFIPESKIGYRNTRASYPAPSSS